MGLDRALERMEAIIADTLAIAHGRQNLGPDDLERLRLRAVVEASWRQTGGQKASLKVNLSEAECPPGKADRSGKGGLEEEVYLRAHEGRLRRLLENLFRNAVDHAGPGVTVTVGRTEDGFFVADDGPGIPPGQRETIFEPSYSSRDDGTGLGLSIVEAVAEAHGWAVSATESRSGGARFEVTGIGHLES